MKPLFSYTFFCSFSMRACWWELEFLAVRQYFIIQAASHMFRECCCSSTVQLIMIVSHVRITGCPSNKCVGVNILVYREKRRRVCGTHWGWPTRLCSHVSIVKKFPKYSVIWSSSNIVFSHTGNVWCTCHHCYIRAHVWCAIWTQSGNRPVFCDKWRTVKKLRTFWNSRLNPRTLPR